jgi:hypothetical protein
MKVLLANSWPVARPKRTYLSCQVQGTDTGTTNTYSAFLWVRIFPLEAQGHHPTGSSQRLQLSIQETHSSPPSTKVCKNKEWFEYRELINQIVSLVTGFMDLGLSFHLFGFYGYGSGNVRPGRICNHFPRIQDRI